jgi:guanylate kinase
MDINDPQLSTNNPKPKRPDGTRNPESEGLPPEIREIIKSQGDVPEIARYVNRPEPSLLVVLTGPSGVGKDVTLQRMKEKGLNFHYVITVTTRERRPSEKDGVHYFFKTRQEYERMKDSGELLENAEVYGNYYGIPRNQVVDKLREGMDVIMKPDVQGARHIREQVGSGAVYIFLAPPSMEVLASRLYHRKTEDPQELSQRLSIAREEMHDLSDFDYVVVNRDNELDETVEEIEAIIRAEKNRVHPRKVQFAR